MKRYIVKFEEIRHYEMVVDAFDEEGAIKKSRTGPDLPTWVNVELDNFRAEAITREPA
ncbi:hypothetical protein [Nitrobacter vulgaris]|uniref:hypothetical protein n=1 Tax=Nitrobacter vulgaris TaxID=29421 RepID=UPI001301D054|nr:hypothetical protein [Nitrobacter vulgaris]